MQIIYTELKDTLEYTCDVNVFNVSMIMRVSYNSRSKKRLISLTSLDGSILYLKPTYITYGSRIFPNFNTIIDGLSFYITLDRLTLTGDNYLNWANQFRLCFVEYVPFEKGEGWYLAENSLEENALTPNFGDWVIKLDDITVENNNILYQAYKTNSILTYDSFATFSLETALIRSFHDVDMQQWQAFKDAVNELTDVTDWVFDTTNNQIKYYAEPSNIEDPSLQYFYKASNNYGGVTPTSPTLDGLRDWLENWHETRNGREYTFSKYTQPYTDPNIISIEWTHQIGSNTYTQNSQVNKVLNPYYDTNAEREENYLPLDTVAQKVISNANSGEDEVLKLLSENYINLVVNSVFDKNPSDQFVKMEDLVDQFEENKTLRS